MWVTQTLPRSTREVSAWIEAKFGVSYASCSGLIELLHRIGLRIAVRRWFPAEWIRPSSSGFFVDYKALLNNLQDDEMVIVQRCRAPGLWRAAGGLLGTRVRADRGGTDHRARASEPARRHRPRNRPNQNPAGGSRRYGQHDRLVERNRGRVSQAAKNPCLPRQCALPPRQIGARVAATARWQDPTELPPTLLPASQPDRAIMGPDAQAHHPQPMLRFTARVPKRNPHLPAPHRLSQVENLLRRRQR